jgi:flavin-dependent dehydrogenase
MDGVVNILGGGISGLACAIILRRNGYNVNVYEKHSSTGSRFNNDWQGMENWSEKIDVLKQIESYGIDVSFDYEPVSELNLHYSDKIKILRGENACYLVKRGSGKDCLDISLLEQAKELGVNINFGYKSDRSVPIKVNATGPKKANMLVKGIKFSTSRKNDYRMAFGKEIAKGFYSYLLINGGEGTIATAFNRKLAHRSEEFLQNSINYFSDYLNENELSDGKKFGGYAHFEIQDSFYDGTGAMLVGEAGGFQDYLWGFGMRYAFQSAYFAARSIINDESYDDLIKKNLLQKMKHSNRNRFIFEAMGSLAYPFVYYLFATNNNPLRLLNIIYR